MTHSPTCPCPSCAAYSVARALLVGTPYDHWLDDLEETPVNLTPRPDDLVTHGSVANFDNSQTEKYPLKKEVP